MIKIIILLILTGCALPSTICERESKRNNDFYKSHECTSDQSKKVQRIGVFFGAMAQGMSQGMSNSSRQSRSDSVVLEKDNSCYYNSDCSNGDRCLKTKGSYGKGICGTVVDRNGFKNYDYNPQVKSCTFDFDCTIGFKCIKLEYRTEGLCFKRQ